MSRATLILRGLLLLAFLFSPALAQDPDDDCETEIESGDDDEPCPLDFEDGKLVLGMAKLAGLERQSELDDQLRAWWTGTIGASKVLVEVRVYPNSGYQMSEPEQVGRFLELWYADPEHGGDPSFRFLTWEIVRCSEGWAPFACLATGKIGTGEAMVLAGVYPTLSYSVSVDARPALDKTSRERMVAFLRGIRSECTSRVPKWTKAEIAKRWGGMPRKVFRTKHYLVMTNSGAGNLFAKKMEQCYTRIHKVFPIPEVEGRRLMPVFLFKNKDQYVGFSVNASRMTREEARATKGHAYLDYYATYYESPNDPVHIHEATHQIFGNRLFLEGGGSWFQEGVAQYMCATKSERRMAGRSHSPPHLQAMIREDQLSGKLYGVAATFVEYLRKAKDRKAMFPQFIQTMGRLQNPTPERVDAAFKSIYGLGFEALGVGWARYWRR